MQAAVVPAVSSSRQVKDLPQPQPGPNQVLHSCPFGKCISINSQSLPSDGHGAPQQNTNDPRPHGLLETRMQARSRKNVRFRCPQMLH